MEGRTEKMEEELKEIISKLNDFSDKYGFQVYVECYEYENIGDRRKSFIYNTRVIKPEISKF